MRIGLLCSLIVIGLTAGAFPRPCLADDTDSKALNTALETLAGTPSGKRLLEQARQTFGQSKLQEIFRWDQVSRTDAVLTRQFDTRTGKESRVREVSIYLKRGQSSDDLLFDLAHELTHAVAGPTWDPYDPGLTPGNYIWSALEGHGGEVDAILSECRVALEIQHSRAASSRCERYLSTQGNILQVSREKVREDFYRTGDWHPQLLKKLGSEASRFPMLSDEPPRLYSSTGSAPYPVALLREYEEITEAACENSRRRLASRGPAAVPDSVQNATRNFLQRRCLN